MDWTYEIWFDGCCIHEENDYDFTSKFEATVDAEEYINDLLDTTEYHGNSFDEFEIKIKKNGEYV